jgi:hypothetical protein
MSSRSWKISTTVTVCWFAGYTCKIIISRIPNSLNYCVIFIVYIRNLGSITQSGGGGRMLETPEAPVCTSYQKFMLQLRYTGLSICNAANMLVITNSHRLTKADASLMGRIKIKSHVF